MDSFFDFNGDGVLDIGERYMEYMTFRAVMGEEEEDEEDTSRQD